tara:strand:+ start:446 stop:1060 length:615 start_codon:yes stop_codon:yes gene_type:complete
MDYQEKENLLNQIIELDKQLTKLEKSEIKTYCVDHHKGVYYCFKLIKDRHWVSYIGFPEHINVNNKKYYYLDQVNEDYYHLEPRDRVNFKVPSEITFQGCGMDVNVMTNVPLDWLGFDYAHRGDLTVAELKQILKKLGNKINIDILSEYEINTLQNDKFSTYEDVKKDCIDCIDSATKNLMDTALNNLTGNLNREINKHNKKNN